MGLAIAEKEQCAVCQEDRPSHEKERKDGSRQFAARLARDAALFAQVLRQNNSLLGNDLGFRRLRFLFNGFLGNLVSETASAG